MKNQVKRDLFSQTIHKKFYSLLIVSKFHYYLHKNFVIFMMEFIFSNIILILAAAQGLLLALLIYQKHRENYANRYLFLLMISYSITLCNLLFHDLNIIDKIPVLILFTGVPLSSFPLHYLYARHLTNCYLRFERRELFHFIPFLLFSVFLTVMYMVQFLNGSSVIEIHTSDSLLNHVFTFTIIIQGFVYTVSTLNIVRNHEIRIREVFSSVQKLQLNWLSNITIFGFLAVLIFFLEYLIFLFGYS